MVNEELLEWVEFGCDLVVNVRELVLMCISICQFSVIFSSRRHNPKVGQAPLAEVGPATRQRPPRPAVADCHTRRPTAEEGRLARVLDVLVQSGRGVLLCFVVFRFVFMLGVLSCLFSVSQFTHCCWRNVVCLN